MGKIKRLKFSRQERTKDESLTQQILAVDAPKTLVRAKSRKRRDEPEKFVTSSLSEKILRQAREQQEELEQDLGITEPDHGDKAHVAAPIPTSSKKLIPGKIELQQNSDTEDEETTEPDAFYEHIVRSASGADLLLADAFRAYFQEISEDDEKALEMFMAKDAPIRQTLAEVLRGKLSEKKTELETAVSEPASLILQKVDPAILDLYQGVRDVLRRYRSGKLPKAFKVIPKLPNWEQVLYITEPDTWSAAAVFQASRLFASNLKDRLAQRFFNLVLLPRIRDDISEYKRLNFHLYQALRKSLFKPGAFFKGILLPLCESGTCTLREAVIISSVMAKNRIPNLHSSAALLKIAEMEYTGANSVFMKTLLDKKYALPYQVIDAVVYHFIRFMSEKRKLPVLWHQCLLTLVQRYKDDLAAEQKEALTELTQHQFHYQISPEVRRELQNSKNRDVEKVILMEE